MSKFKHDGRVASASCHPTLGQACERLRALQCGEDGQVSNVRVIREGGVWFVSWIKHQTYKVQEAL